MIYLANENWQPYRGKRGGKGWIDYSKNPPEVRYGDKPGSHSMRYEEELEKEMPVPKKKVPLSKSPKSTAKMKKQNDKFLKKVKKLDEYIEKMKANPGGTKRSMVKNFAYDLAEATWEAQVFISKAFAIGVAGSGLGYLVSKLMGM